MKYLHSPLASVLAFSFALTGLSSLSAAVVTINTSADAAVRGPSANVANANYGTESAMVVGTVTPGTDLRHLLLRFDLSSIPAGSTINSVSLTMIATGNDATSQSSLTLNVFELTAANTTWGQGTATWNTIDGTSGWAGGTSGAGIAGTDYINTLLASFSGNPQTIAAGDSMSYTSEGAFSAAVANNIGGDLNLVLLNDGAMRDLFRIASLENTTYSPAALTVDFTSVPEPSTMALGMMALVSWLVFRRRRVSFALWGSAPCFREPFQLGLANQHNDRPTPHHSAGHRGQNWLRTLDGLAGHASITQPAARDESVHPKGRSGIGLQTESADFGANESGA